MKRRRIDSTMDSNKRIRLVDAQGRSRAVKVTPPPPAVGADSDAKPEPLVQRSRINKLAPPRPFPTVPKSVSATGPRSAHKEGKNLICITRKTPLAAYLRRCKNIILNDGYKTLHLSAMGAAIPHLLQLSVALPPILPFAADEMRTEIRTGTMEVQDEIVPEDEEEEITYRTRGKSTLMIVLTIGDGEFEGDTSGPAKKAGARPKGKAGQAGPKANLGTGVTTAGASGSGSRVVFEEPDQDDMDV